MFLWRFAYIRPVWFSHEVLPFSPHGKILSDKGLNPSLFDFKVTGQIDEDDDGNDDNEDDKDDDNEDDDGDDDDDDDDEED